MSPSEQAFGGNWTEQKLGMLRDYLSAYCTALKNKPFRRVYIDAFAGTGYREARTQTRMTERHLSSFFPELGEDETQGFLDGSARIALAVRPSFHEYVFVEKSPGKARELAVLKTEFADLAERIVVVTEDCNGYLRRICEEWDWRLRRAVVFLDPFGMQVEWATIASIASTKAIDLWVLFPLGVAVNRLLARNGNIPEPWVRRLTAVFGTIEWKDRFYKDVPKQTFFGPVAEKRKTATLESISRFYNDRLKSVFAEVAPNPRELVNSRGSPLFLLCFAAANPKGAPIALRIANHILKESYRLPFSPPLSGPVRRGIRSPAAPG